MTKDDIIDVAKEAELLDDDQDEVSHPRFTEMLVALAHLAAAAEREACAKLALSVGQRVNENGIAAAIRARGNT